MTARASLLLVEDDADLAKALCGRLAHAGYEVRLAGSLGAAREALRAARPDLVLLDIMLPDGRGLELLGSIRADENLRSLPVILQTCLGGNDDVLSGFTSGANAYLGKPVDSARLLAVIARLLAETHGGAA